MRKFLSEIINDDQLSLLYKVGMLFQFQCTAHWTDIELYVLHIELYVLQIALFVKQQKHLLRINPRTFSMTFQSKITMIRSIQRIHHCYSRIKNIRSGWGGRVLQRESEISDLTARQWDHLQAGIQPLQSAGGTMQTPSKESTQSVSCWCLVTSLRWEGGMCCSSVVISLPRRGLAGHTNVFSSLTWHPVTGPAWSSKTHFMIPLPLLTCTNFSGGQLWCVGVDCGLC